MLCGSSCVKYILNSCGKDYKISKKMRWITELALSLKRNGLSSIEVLNYNSNLYNDYKLIGKDNLKFNAFSYIRDVLNEDIPLNEKRMNSDILKEEVIQNKYVILCVESRLFNNDENMSGGHFIILSLINNDNLVRVINPIKDKYETKYLTLEFLVKCCCNYGSWRILIKEEE